MEAQLEFAHFRRLASRLVVALLWIHVAVVVAVGWFLAKPWIWSAIAAVACAGAVTAFMVRCGQTAVSRILCGVALTVSASIIVGMFEGLKIQLDLHMYYFATLAILVATCDYRAIAAAVITVAVHHLIFGFALPNLIYPGGIDFSRLALHAGVLVVEAATLIWLVLNIEKTFGALAQRAAPEKTLRFQEEATLAEKVLVEKRRRSLNQRPDISVMAARAGSRQLSGRNWKGA